MPPEPTALIVDDDPDVLEAVETWLAAEFRCTSAESVAAALEASRRTTYDLALVDYRLPDGRGLDLIKALREDNPRIAVVFMTGYGDYSVAAEAVESGAASLLEKPFFRKKLQSAAHAALVAIREGALPPRGDDRLERVLRYIRENASTGPRENQLLRDLGFSRSAFHVFFRDNMGVSFRTYVARERLKGAKYLLASTTLGPSQIAVRLGLRSPSYFTAWFRGMVGLTPLAYRREARTAGVSLVNPDPGPGGDGA